MTLRTVRAYNAALLPFQEPGVIEAEMRELQNRLSDVDINKQAEETERENSELIAKAQAHAAAVIARRRAAGKPGKRAPKRPKGARRIR